MIDVLIDNGAKVDMASNDGWTALMYACQEGHLGAVKALIAAGTNVNQKNKGNKDALHIAKHHKHYDIVNTLKKNGAKEYVHVKPKKKRSAVSPAKYAMVQEEMLAVNV